MKTKYLLVVIAAVLIVGCNSENPFITKEQAEQIIEGEKPKSVEFAVAIVNNDIYWIRNFDNKPKKLTQNVTGSKKTIRLAHNHSKFAFINSSGSVVVMDTLGKVIDTKSFGTIKQMDWSDDDKTLWMLVGNSVKFYGNSLTLPGFDTDSDDQIVSMAVTPKLDIIYINRQPLGLGRYSETLEYRGHDGYSQSIDAPSSTFLHMETLRLAKDKQHFVLGHSENAGDYDLVKITSCSLTENFAKENLGSANYYIDAVYDSKASYIVTAFSSESYEDFDLEAIYLKNEFGEPSRNKFVSGVSAPAGKIFIDWK